MFYVLFTTNANRWQHYKIFKNCDYSLNKEEEITLINKYNNVILSQIPKKISILKTKKTTKINS